MYLKVLMTIKKTIEPIIKSLNCPSGIEKDTLIFLSFQTDRSGQTVQTEIRLLLEEQSDQGLHCLQFQMHYSKEKPSC